MLRCICVVGLLLFSKCLYAQTTTPSSDLFAISLAQKSITAQTGGAAISDVTFNANVMSDLGTTTEPGTGTFAARGLSESRIDLTLSVSGTRSDVRNWINGAPGGAWQAQGATANAYAQHNCWVDAAWFFPPLSTLSQSTNPNFVFKYIGQEQHLGTLTQHIQVFQLFPQDTTGAFQTLSAMDFYLDSASYLPIAITFYVHPDDDMNTNVSIEIGLSNYQLVNGIQVPFRIQRTLNGGLTLDASVTTIAFNTGLPDTLFVLQ